MSSVLAKIDLEHAPVGWIFDSRDPDTSVEDDYFDGWRLPLTPHKYWQRASPFIIDEEEDGRPILECNRSNDAAMIAGDQDWADYTVSAGVRLIGTHAHPDEDNPTSTEARAGVIGRYQTSRHYYFLALVSTGRVVLYARADGDWSVLAEAPVDPDPRRYYSLTLDVEGSRITGIMDGTVLLETTDERYLCGPAGIRTNVRARFDGVAITAGEAEPDATEVRRTTRLRRKRDIQSQYPQAKLVAQYSKPEWEHEYATLGHLAHGGEWGLLLHNSAQVFSASFARTYSSSHPMCVGVADLSGNLLWGRDMDLRFPRVIEGAERDNILGIMDKSIVVLSSEDGSVVAETRLPEACPFQGARGSLIAPDLFPWYFADLRGTGIKCDILLKDDRDSRGGRTVWAYDDQLESLWTARVGFPRYGHTLAACDIDCDGRDEVLAGFHCFDSDGSLLWKCREAEINDDDHVDEVHLGLFGPSGEPRACGTNGGDGFHLIDGDSGEIISRPRLGHVQGVSVGNYLPDRPGKDYCVGSRWGSFGILNVIDAEGNVVTTWEPDNVSQGGPPVRWSAGAQELIFLNSSDEAFGLWDGYGNRCVTLACEELPYKGFYGIGKAQSSVLDIDGDGLDELVFTFPEDIFVYKAEE